MLRRSDLRWGLLALPILAALFWLHTLLPHRENITAVVALIVGSTIVLYGGTFFLRRSEGPSLRLLLFVAIGMRLVVLPFEPDLSDDAWRYLWDGRLVATGESPYGRPPMDPDFAGLHDGLYDLQGYPDSPTIYPPGVQLLFASAVALADVDDPGVERSDAVRGILVWKLLLFLAEIVAILLLVRTLELLERPRYPAILYAWHPLAVVEIVGQGHTDGLWVLALVLGFYAYVRGTSGRGLGALSFGTAVRVFPILLIPLWLRYLDRRAIVAGVLASIPFGLLFLVFLEPGALTATTDVGARFTNFFEFNGGIYYGVKEILDASKAEPSNRIAGAITTIGMLGGILAVTLWPIRQKGLDSLLFRATLIVTLQIVLTAKIHVWYAAAPLLLVALERRPRLGPLWYWLALTLPLSYLYYAVDPNAEQMWVLLGEWGGGALIALGTWIFVRSRPHPPACEKV